MEHLWLGTAQLGQTYGIANRTGQPSRDEAQALLKSAFERGIRYLDTAQDYGDSEKIIGDFHRQTSSRFKVISKIPAHIDLTNPADLEACLRQSASNLALPLHSVLVRSSAQALDWSAAVERSLKKCLALKLCEKIGISVYDETEFEAALRISTLQIIQAPLNVLDRRFLEAGLIQRALRSGKTVVLRSVFLQGLLLMKVEDLPPELAEAKPLLHRFASLCEEFRCSRRQAAVGYVLARCPECECVLGVESRQQLNETADAFALGPLREPRFLQSLDELQSATLKIIDPRQWGPRG